MLFCILTPHSYWWYSNSQLLKYKTIKISHTSMELFITGAASGRFSAILNQKWLILFSGVISIGSNIPLVTSTTHRYFRFNYIHIQMSFILLLYLTSIHKKYRIHVVDRKPISAADNKPTRNGNTNKMIIAYMGITHEGYYSNCGMSQQFEHRYSYSLHTATLALNIP